MVEVTFNKELYKAGKPKLIVYYLKIFLACLICILSFLDAPEYVHCTHLGVCEFLEVYGNLNASREAEKISLFHQKFDLSVPIYMVSQYINPDYKKIIPLPLKKWDKIPVNPGHVSFSIINYLPSQTLQIIGTSIINS